MKQEESPLRSEVSPAIIAVVIGVIVLAIGGFLVFKNMSGPKFLTGNAGATKSDTEQRKHLHTDEVTGIQTTKD
ncbi:MAG: hypothetical protein SFU56_01865 [Capsulimonadales bacterium]|nr:hypothetical protein [Capsulimonadales bacterium]